MLNIVPNSDAPKDRTFFDRDGVWAYVCSIPYTRTHMSVIYWVSGKNGDEYGQFQTEMAAIHKAAAIAALPIEERRKFDE